MFIPSINNITPIQYIRSNYKQNVSRNCPTFKSALSTDVFEKDKESFNKFNDFTIDKFKDFTIDEYKRLSPDEIKAINKSIDGVYGKSLETALKYHEIAAEGIKNYLDDFCGKDSYVVIPIGRSISSIGKCLSYKIGDENVKVLPMSHASRFIDLDSCNEDFDALQKYLDSIGLSKKEIETSGKTYIFTDYCSTGASLIGVQNLFKSDKIYGNQPNLVFINIEHLLQNVQPNEIRSDAHMSNSDFLRDLDYILCQCSFKNYSLVNRCTNLAKTKDAVINPNDYSQEAKSFMFKMMESEMNK